MRPSKNDTEDLWIRRIVQSGGRIRYKHEWYQHPKLLEHVGREILVHDYAFLGMVTMHECLYPYGTSRKARPRLRSNQPLWTIGTLIVADVKPE